jgi:hypothetical protein
MIGVLNLTRPILFLELHGAEAAAIAWEVLTQAGYRLHAMRTSYPTVERPDDLPRKAYLVALPDHPA